MPEKKVFFRLCLIFKVQPPIGILIMVSGYLSCVNQSHLVEFYVHNVFFPDTKICVKQSTKISLAHSSRYYQDTYILSVTLQQQQFFLTLI